MEEKDVLKGQVLVNGKDIWEEYGAFLREEQPDDDANLAALLAPSKPKVHVAVDFREQNGEKYSKRLVVRSEARDVTLQLAIMAKNRAEFLLRYATFVKMLKEGEDGWTTWSFPTIGLVMKMICTDFSSFQSLSSMWVEGEQCGAFKVTMREPEPSF